MNDMYVVTIQNKHKNLHMKKIFWVLEGLILVDFYFVNFLALQKIVVESIFMLKWIYQTHFRLIFSCQLCRPGVINKDPSVWLDAARPANTSFPPSFPGNTPVQPRSILTPQNTYASIEKLATFSEMTYL
jgi:hypothetical protein